MELTEGASLFLCSTRWLPKSLQCIRILYQKFYRQYSAYLNSILVAVLFQLQAVFPTKTCTLRCIQLQFLQIEKSVLKIFSCYLKWFRSSLLGNAGSNARTTSAAIKISPIILPPLVPSLQLGVRNRKSRIFLGRCRQSH